MLLIKCFLSHAKENVLIFLLYIYKYFVSEPCLLFFFLSVIETDVRMQQYSSSLTLVRALMWGLQVSHFGATTFLKCAGGLCSWLLGLSGNYPMDLYVIHMPQLLNTFCIKGDNFGDNPKTSHSKMFMSYQNAISHHNKEKNNSKTASEWQLYRYNFIISKFFTSGFYLKSH